MGTDDELLWRFYLDYVTHARHHETLRATTTTILLAIDAGVIGLLRGTHAWPLPHGYALLSTFLIALGSIRAVFSRKYHERFQYWMNHAAGYRNDIERRYPTLDGDEKRKVADKKTQDKYYVFFPHRLHWYWVLLHLPIAAMGLLLTIWILSSPPVDRPWLI